jgi:hypothetical protein
VTRRRNSEAPRRDPVSAEGRGECQVCSQPFDKGAVVASWPDGWAHIDCANAYPEFEHNRDRVMSGRTQPFPCAFELASGPDSFSLNLWSTGTWALLTAAALRRCGVSASGTARASYRRVSAPPDIPRVVDVRA